MFTLKINGNTEPFAIENETTFGQVMEKLSAQMNENGRVITRILMNDQSLVGGKQVDYYMYPLENVETIELITADPRMLVKDAITSLREFRQELKSDCERAAELFRLGDELEANDMYSRVIEGWRWIVKGVNSMSSLLKIDHSSLEIGGRDYEEFQNDVLLSLFDRMLEAQQHEDWITLADLLEFELAEILGDWDGILNQLEMSAN